MVLVPTSKNSANWLFPGCTDSACGGGNGKGWTDSITGAEFIFVKGGCFQMGDIFGEGNDREKPVHEVCVDDFYLGKYLVTQGEWRKVMGGNPSRFKYGNKFPVDRVSWEDAQSFIRKLNSQKNKGYRFSGRMPREIVYPWIMLKWGRDRSQKA